MKVFNEIIFFLYDSLGIMLPGGFFSLFLLLITKQDIKKLYINICNNIDKNIVFLFLMLIIFYIFGNLMKIIAQIFYDFFEAVEKTVLLIYNKIEKNLINCFKDSIYSKIFIKIKNFPITKFMIKYFKLIFCFRADKYFTSNEFMINKIKEKDIITEKNWYGIYKIGKIYEENKKVSSLSYIFLAKYTLYRSLSCLLFINFIYFMVVKDNYLIFYEEYGFGIKIINFLLWITFHIKYKKYYTFCGNDTLVALYCKIFLFDEEIEKYGK